MGARLHVDPPVMELIERRLSVGPDEQLVFLAARWDGDTATAFDHRLVPAESFDVQSPAHLALTDVERARVIKWAHDRDGALVEMHSHRYGDPAGFSPTDLAGLAEFVPHVWWRLGHRPYAALVFGGSSFDAIVWRRGPASPEALEALVVAGSRDRLPTGHSLRRRNRS